MLTSCLLPGRLVVVYVRLKRTHDHTAYTAASDKSRGKWSMWMLTRCFRRCVCVCVCRSMTETDTGSPQALEQMNSPMSTGWCTFLNILLWFSKENVQTFHSSHTAYTRTALSLQHGNWWTHIRRSTSTCDIRIILVCCRLSGHFAILPSLFTTH